MEIDPQRGSLAQYVQTDVSSRMLSPNFIFIQQVSIGYQLSSASPRRRRAEQTSGSIPGRPPSLKPSPEAKEEPEGPGSQAVGSASVPQAAGPQTLVHNRCAFFFFNERI